MLYQHGTVLLHPPAAQFPSALPPASEHSFSVWQVPVSPPVTAVQGPFWEVMHEEGSTVHADRLVQGLHSVPYLELEDGEEGKHLCKEG